MSKKIVIKLNGLTKSFFFKKNGLTKKENVHDNL